MLSGLAQDLRLRIPFTRWEVASLVLAASLSIIYARYKLIDLFVYLPMARYLQDPSLYPGSPLIQDLLSLPYPLYRLYALVYHQYVFYLIFVATRFLFVLGLVLFGKSIWRDRSVVWIGVILVIFTPGAFGTLGQSSVLLFEANQQAVAVPILVFALALAAARRFDWGFAVAGLAFNLHPIVSTVVLLILAAQVLPEAIGQTPSISLRQIGRLFTLAFLAALPTIVWILAQKGTSIVAIAPNSLEIARFALYFHLFPSTFSPQEYVTTALMLAYLALSVKQNTLGLHRPFVLISVGVIAFYCLIGILFSEVIPTTIILKLMPFRSTIFLKIICLFCAASYLRFRMRSGMARDYLIVAFTIFGFLVNERILLWALTADILITYLSGRLGWLAGAAAAALALFALLEVLLNPNPPRFLSAIALDPRELFFSVGLPNTIIAAALALIVVLGDYLGRCQPYRIASLVGRAGFEKWSTVAVLTLLAVGTILILAVPAPLDERIQIPMRPPLSDLERAENWARENTPIQTIFITPPDIEYSGFMLLSQRSTVGDYKQAGQALLDAQFGPIIYRRLADLGCPGPWMPWCVGNRYGSFDAATFRVVAARYGACDVLTTSTQNVELPLVYENESFHIYSACEQ